MAERQSNAQERRIHELDQNVERYFEVRKRLGKGAYGIVWKATDKRKKETVALKKIYDAFRDETDAQRTYREVVFLRAFRHHPNIIRMLDIFKAANNLDFYLVFEFMDSDLHNVIKKGDVLKDIHKRFVMYQLINAIKYMHSGNVIHRDLKPSNILIDSKCRLKVADFGLARTLCPKRRNNLDFDCKEELENEAMLTDYVATRWYRAPEILVASRKYTKGIDMWSLGCILGEMIRQKPLFQGTSTINQIEKIVNALPEVTDRDIESIGASFGSVLLSKKIVRDRRHSLDEMLGCCCHDAISLVKSLLVLDPDGRLTAKEAIAHSYVHRFRTASATMELNTDIKPPLDDDVRYSVNDYRSTLYDMISPEMRSSARHSNSTTMTPSSGSEVTQRITTRCLRSVSKSKQSSSHVMTTKTFPDYTKVWVEQQRKHQQLQQQQHEQLQQQQHQQLQQLQQQQHRSKRFYPEHNQQPRGSTGFAVEPKPVALRRELAAVAATAPRTANGGLWQTPVVAQTQAQIHSQLQPQPQPALHLWTEPVPVPGPLPIPVPAPEPESMMSASQLRARVRRLRKDCKEKRQSKQKESADEQQAKQAQTQSQTQSQTQDPDLTQTQMQELAHSQAVKMARAELKVQRERIRKEQTVDLAITLERLQLEHEELQKKNKIIEAEAMKQQHPREMQSQQQPIKVKADDFYTAKGTVREARPADFKRLKSEATLKQEIEQNLGGHMTASAAFVCYKSRLSRLEEEMAKCKRQLFHYVQDNEQLLHKRSVRHHVEQLLQSSPSPPATASSRQTDSGVEVELQATLQRDQQQLNLGHLKLERDKQKQLQLREFLARDESNANAYELPNLSNVYKVSSCHAQLLPQSQSYSQYQSQIHSQSQSQSLSQSQGSSQSLHSANNYVPQKTRHKQIFSNYFPPEEEMPCPWNEPKQSTPYHDRICIQEANFYQDYDLANFEDQHLTRK
ncbi:extracellular signal-regulated kinase 7 [Drosophila innubila]|uniref:extracellular signal-regulated kinase 7 n=1 Tax=Drosophila innubila TaxID=198719 RepID=UPI00148D01CB|nr:extracellular signal-regulated kinase 7 [Drosophila innubila]